MRVLRKGAVCLLAAAILLGGVASAQTSDMKAEFARMKAKMASMESLLAGPGSVGGGEAPSLRSLKRKASIQIGGDVNVDIIFKHRDDITSDYDHVDSTQFHTNSANLRFKINATQSTYLYIKLDLDDAWDDDRLDGIGDQDDLLEEVKFVWKSVRNSNWGLVFGKGEVPYGQDKTLGIIQSYHHNDQTYTSEGPVFLVAGTEEAFGRDDFSVGNPHSNVGNTSKPGEVDNVFMIQVNYIHEDWLKFEVALFQNNDTLGRGAPTRGMHEDRADDHLLFQSMAARIWLLPSENMTVEISLIRKYVDSFGDLDINSPKPSEESYAFSIGFDYKAKSWPIEVFGELQHAWNWNYTKGYEVDIIQLGLIWGTTKDIDIGFMYEWMEIGDPNVLGNENYQKFVTSIKYTFKSGIYSILEYGYEYFDGAVPGGGDDDRDAHVLAFRTGWIF